MTPNRGLALLRRLFGTHLDGQAALLAELRALREVESASAAKLEAMQLGLSRLQAVLQHGQAQRRQLAQASIVAADGRHADPLSLTRHHAQVYSQNGEDGLIAEIFRRIGPGGRTFLEVGVESGVQNNTRLLLEQGWCGIWVEASRRHAEEAARRFAEPIAAGRLTILCTMAAPATLDAVLDRAGAPARFDFLSLDIDQHTSHLWRGLRRRTRVACIEYNASLPASLAAEVPFEAARSWDGTSWFGASLKTMEMIGAAKGLHLVGCERVGANAFFVDAAETAGRFRAPFTAETHWEPPLYALVAQTGHPPAQAARPWLGAPAAKARPAA
ncbi:MAG: hypothetical protein JWP04_134 [Belnapia sp.]|nr:hypothetical protein [Belnapia sp.]